MGQITFTKMGSPMRSEELKNLTFDLVVVLYKTAIRIPQLPNTARRSSDHRGLMEESGVPIFFSDLLHPGLLSPENFLLSYERMVLREFTTKLP